MSSEDEKSVLAKHSQMYAGVAADYDERRPIGLRKYSADSPIVTNMVSALRNLAVAESMLSITLQMDLDHGETMDGYPSYLGFSRATEHVFDLFAAAKRPIFVEDLHMSAKLLGLSCEVPPVKPEWIEGLSKAACVRVNLGLGQKS